MAAGELARVARALPQYPELIQDAELIRSQSLRCRAILDRLQEQAGDPPRTLKLSEVWTSLRSRFPQAELEVTGEERNALVHVPTESFVQAMACLVKNALDAQAPFRWVRIKVDAVGDDIRFSVIDSGPQVSEEVRRRAGEPFFTTKPAGQGMGLGLFLVKAMAQQLCGAFRLESHAAGGTAAVLQFPKESR
jgi:two-component system sensor histidine kinase RegB